MAGENRAPSSLVQFTTSIGARLDPVSPLAVEIAQCEPANAALGRAADPGGFHQLAPQPLAVDFQVLHVRLSFPPSSFRGGTEARSSATHDTGGSMVQDLGHEFQTAASRLSGGRSTGWIPNTAAANCG